MAHASNEFNNFFRSILAADAGDPSLLNVARRQRMLRELGYFSDLPAHFHLKSDSNGSTSEMELSPLCSLEEEYEQLRAQLDAERRLRMEATSRAEAMKKAWEVAQSKVRSEMALRIQAERAREEAESRLAAHDKVRTEPEGEPETVMDTAGPTQTDENTDKPGNGLFHSNPVLAQALDEMMARIQAEQRIITEKRVRAAAEDCGKDETAEHGRQKHGVLQKVLGPFRNRLPH